MDEQQEDLLTPSKRRRKVKANADKKYECQHVGCGKTYSRAEHLYRHQLNRKSNGFPLSCVMKLTDILGQTNLKPSITVSILVATATLFDKISVCATKNATVARAHSCKNEIHPAKALKIPRGEVPRPQRRAIVGNHWMCKHPHSIPLP